MQFANTGYEVVPHILSSDELALAAQIIQNLIERHRTSDASMLATSVSIADVTRQYPDRNPGVVAVSVEKEPYIIGDLIELDARFGCLLANAALWQLAARCLACAFDEVVYHFANITRKPPGVGPAVGWHRDAENRYFASSDDRTVRILLPIQAMSEANGGTAVVPQSHLDAAGNNVTPPQDIVHPTVEAGAALVIHAKLLHGGQPNRSDSERDIIVVQFGVSTSSQRFGVAETMSLQKWPQFAALRGGTSLAA
jgi:ectoine hydroxylase-related dioxygenase (phytanoyl-CoA dioxygenase family)